MYDPGVVKVLETLHDLEDVSGGQGLVQLVMHREIVVEALTLTTEERENNIMKKIAMLSRKSIMQVQKESSVKVQIG